MIVLYLLAIAFVAFVVTFYVTPLLILFAQKINLLDRPDGLIKVHKSPTPYLGGLAVYTGFIAALALFFPFENNVFLLLVGITLLLIIGLIDDLIVLKPLHKFLGQFIAVFCFLKAGYHLKINLFSHWWNIFLSGFWMLSIINAFNLVDVMDGLASTLAIGASFSFLAIALFSDAYPVALLLGAFLGAILAFLWYNKPVAQIYLGDAGSLFIGGLLANIPFLLDWGTYSKYGYLAPIVILAIPGLEVTTLIIIRTYKGIPFYRGSPHHFSMFLKQQGWPVPLILAYVMILSLILGFAATLIYGGMLQKLGIFVTTLLFLAVWFAVLLKKHIL